MNSVAISSYTKKSLEEKLSDEGVRFLTQLVNIEEDEGASSEEEAILELTKLKAEKYDEVIIVTPSNAYDEYDILEELDNVKVKSIGDANKHIMKNWRL